MKLAPSPRRRKQPRHRLECLKLQVVSLEERRSASDLLLGTALAPSMLGVGLTVPDVGHGLPDRTPVQPAPVLHWPAPSAPWFVEDAGATPFVPAGVSAPSANATGTIASADSVTGSNTSSTLDGEGNLYTPLPLVPPQPPASGLWPGNALANGGAAGATGSGTQAGTIARGRAGSPEPSVAPVPVGAPLITALPESPNGSLVQAGLGPLPAGVAAHDRPVTAQARRLDTGPPPGGPLISSVQYSPATGAANVCVDTPLSITFDTAPVLGTSGTIAVHRADGSTADSIDLADPNSFKRYIGGAAAGGVPYPFNYYPVIITGNTASIYLHQQLDYGQTYYVTMDAGLFTDADGNAFPGISDADTWQFATKDAAPPVGTSLLNVAADGTGDFCTVQGAIDFVPQNNTQRVVIDVHPGVYNEIVYVRSNKAFITVDGEDRDSTIIQYPNNNNLNGAVSGNFRAMFGVDAPDFVLSNITLHNTTPHGGSQAEAFRGNNQRILLNHVNLMSFQDTLLLGENAGSTGFVNDSYIEGDVDFMWGYGTVFFQNSELKAVTSNGYYTQIRNGQRVNGDVFVNCRLTRADDTITGSYLSRIDPNVFPYSQVVYINTAMDSHIRPVGWLLNNATDAPNVEFWEYHSTDLDGNPVDVSQRAPFSRQLTDAEAAYWSDPANVLGGWVPDLTPPTFDSLTASPDVLWPPNHKMVPVTLTADVTDDTDPAPRTRIVAVASNEPPDDRPDWRVTGDLTLKLRAERDGGGSGRVYTITVESRDFSGNISDATVSVTVPHNR